jgi:hypothetical protein
VGAERAQHCSPQVPVEEPESPNLKIARNRLTAANMTSVGLEYLTFRLRDPSPAQFLGAGPAEQDRWTLINA